eukprot:1369156-Amphidinium_carterae.1
MGAPLSWMHIYAVMTALPMVSNSIRGHFGHNGSESRSRCVLTAMFLCNYRHYQGVLQAGKTVE